MKYLAYAKINLRLNVLRKNENNYHDLSMLNAKISLADEIEIKESDKNVVKYSCEELNRLENNLCLNVLNELVNKFNIKERYNIYIKKNIPMGAGLGGGSSDVACVINIIDQLHNLKLTLNEKINIGLKYGADVPYCLINSLAVVEGVGEKITTLDISLKERVVVLYPNIFISTKSVFNSVKSYSKKLSVQDIKKYIINKDYEKLLFNDLEKVTFELSDELLAIKKSLLKIGPTIMSGSGSSMIVFIKNDSDVHEIKKMYPNYLVFDSYIL